jgi:uncharacterized protein (DUF433 family)
MDWRQYIEQHPDVMLGKPVIKGTRLTVELILERLGDGWSSADLLEAYPDLRPEHVQAAQSYAAAYLALDESVLADQGAR